MINNDSFSLGPSAQLCCRRIHGCLFEMYNEHRSFGRASTHVFFSDPDISLNVRQLLEQTSKTDMICLSFACD